MRKVKLLVNTTIGEVTYEAGLEIQVTDGEYDELIRLKACTDVVEEENKVSGKKQSFFKQKG
jgi:hypothetical protein